MEKKRRSKAEPPQELLERYTWTNDVLGEGGSSQVFSIVHKRTLEKRACKRVPKQGFGPALQRELHTLSLLQHPHIVQYYEHFEDAHFVYIVLQLCNRGELFQYVAKQDGLDEAEAKLLFAQVLSAIEYLHGNLIAHRDLKMENVWLELAEGWQAEGHVVRVGDFGFSRQVLPEERSNTYCGSPFYVAPEIAQHSEYDPYRADLWALGVLLAALSLGRYPFTKAEPELYIQELLNGQPEIVIKRRDRCSLSPELSDLIHALLCYEPKQRLRIDLIKQHPWMKGHAIPAYLPLRPPHETIQRTLVQCIVALGFGEEEVWLAIGANDCSKMCVAIYHLLVERSGQRRRYIDLDARTSSESDLTQPAERPLRQHRSADSEVEVTTPPPLLRKFHLHRTRRRTRELK